MTRLFRVCFEDGYGSEVRYTLFAEGPGSAVRQARKAIAISERANHLWAHPERWLMHKCTDIVVEDKFGVVAEEVRA